MPQHALENYLQRVELKALTPTTVTDPERLQEELAKVRQRGLPSSTVSEKSVCVPKLLETADAI
ncbi:hypothetical protein FDW83_18180 [Pseudarthrobacter sp. NamE2]|uniref:IclR family transcriptional regulator domain-containing protein n=1 Tax=Pseudarthrobacter sp. NamE2 TaxID=2576838 RepID=UPI0010FE9ECD|nr:hypothetical protein FDW83_18180 [Pseudarthrobacter sp. NamE2]